MLLTAHNLRYYADLMAAMRTAIETGRVADFAAAFTEGETRSREARVECPA
jgi:queuine tRNA-ribosyltransferase